MRRMLVVLAISALVLFVACGGDEAEAWPEQSQTDYLAGCEDSGGTPEACECALDTLMEEFPGAGENPEEIPPERFASVAEECANS